MDNSKSNEQVVSEVAHFIFSDNKDLGMTESEANKLAVNAACWSYQDNMTQSEWMDATYAKLGYK